jgi:hypothetical protein
VGVRHAPAAHDRRGPRRLPLRPHPARPRVRRAPRAPPAPLLARERRPRAPPPAVRAQGGSADVRAGAPGRGAPVRRDRALPHADAPRTHGRVHHIPRAPAAWYTHPALLAPSWVLTNRDRRPRRGRDPEGHATPTARRGDARAVRRPGDGRRADARAPRGAHRRRRTRYTPLRPRLHSLLKGMRR